MHREMVISFKCNLTGNTCNDIFTDCKDCKSKMDAFFVKRQNIFAVPMELDKESYIGRTDTKYLQKIIDQWILKIVDFSEISKELNDKYKRYRKFLEANPMILVRKFYYRDEYPLVVETDKYLYIFSPD